MEIVNLVHLKFGRFGTASGIGYGGGSLYEITRETESLEIEDLRKLVISVAHDQGESGSLEELKRVKVPGDPAIIFDIHAGSTTYSTPYVVCKAFPALKANGRYFKLTEVDM